MSMSEPDDRLIALRDSLPGQVLAGSEGRRYPIGECIGTGGQGRIFRATWNGSVDVVVKLLRPDHLSKEALPRFQREAAILRTLSQQDAPNPHVVRFFDNAFARLRVPGAGEWNLPFTVLEFVDGETLADALKQERGRGLGLERARRIVQHIVLALEDVHRHDIVHRDLKPTNVLIDRQSGREIAKVTDFGLAKMFQGDGHRTDGLAGATYGYAPPEQFEKGNKRVGRPTDVFSLAALFFEMLSGAEAFPYDQNAPAFLAVFRTLGKRPTFAAVSTRLPAEISARPDAIAALDKVLARALDADPGKRYPTVTDFNVALSDVLSRVDAGISRLDLLPPGSAQPVSSVDARSDGRFAGFDRTEELRWRTVVARPWSRPARAIALSLDGREAAAVGPDGLLLWNGRAWTRLALPRDRDPVTLEAVAWLGNRMVLCGSSPVVLIRGPDGTYSSCVFNLPGVEFHGAYADPAGVVLAGERLGAAGSTGLLAMMTVQASGLSLTWVDVPGAGPLRAAIRLDRAILACGDGGALAVMQGGRLETTFVCGPPLLALAAAGDGSAVVVGGGGFVFRVQRTLEARLQAIQTTKTLRAIARSPDGSLYCGGEERRVLRWTPTPYPSPERPTGTWMRTGSAGAPGVSVIALAAAPERVIAFCDDGCVLEGGIPNPVSSVR